MKVPALANAIIEHQKLVHYLLNAAHPDNGGKAAFFLRLGFAPDDPPSFAQALHNVLLTNDIFREAASAFGTKYIVDGILTGPAGLTAKVRTVWIVEPNARVPRLVTAYPSTKM